MADKESKNRAHDEQLEDEISTKDLDTLELDDPEAGNTTSEGSARKPDSPTKEMVIEGIKGVGSGARWAIKEELYKAMPNLQSIASETGNMYSEFKDLKDELGRQLGPMLVSLESSTRKVLPKAKGLIPKKLYEKIDKKLKQRADDRAASTYVAPTKEQLENSQIQDELAAIFNAQQEQQQTVFLEGKKTELTRLAVEGARHKQITGNLTHLYDAARSTELFHRTLHTAYLKKSLELKFKHLFVARDTYNLVAKSSAAIESYLKSLVKNTMLPDMMKVQIGDYHRRNVTQRYGEMMANFMGGIRGRIIGGIKQAARNAVSGFGNFADMVGMAADMSESMDGMPGAQPKGLKGLLAKGIGSLIGAVGGGALAKKYLGKIKPATDNIDETLGNMKTTAALKMSNLSRRWSMSDNPILMMLSSVIPQLNVRKVGENSLLNKADAPATFDQMTRQSIVEIIPGYLSKMLHAMEKIRTGDDNVEQEVFNVYSRKFTTISELKESATARMYGQNDRTELFAKTIGTLRTGFDRKETGEDSKAHYEKVSKDINRFMVNHGIQREGFRPDVISEYVLSGGQRGDKSYIAKVTEGFENDPIVVLQAILDGITDKNGNLDKKTVSNIETIIVSYLRNDSYVTELPKLGEIYGYRSIFSDKINTATKRALQKKAEAGDKDAAKKLKELSGLFADDNGLNLASIAEMQANVDTEAESTQKNVDEETVRRTEARKASDAGDAQIDAMMERTGLKKAGKAVKSGYDRVKSAMADRYDKTMAFITKEGQAVTAQAVRVAKEARKNITDNYDTFVPEEVKRAISEIKELGRFGVADEAKKMLNRIEKAYGDHVPVEVQELIKDVRESFRVSNVASNLREEAKNKVKQAAEEAVKANQPVEPEDLGEPKEPVKTPEQKLEETINAALSGARPTQSFGSGAPAAPSKKLEATLTPKAVPASVFPTGPIHVIPDSSPLENLVTKISADIERMAAKETVVPQESFVVPPEESQAAEVPTSSENDLLKTWFDLYKYNAEFQQEQIEDFKKFVSDEHGAIFDSVAQVDETIRALPSLGGSGQPPTGGGGGERRHRGLAGMAKDAIKGGVNIAGKTIKNVGKAYTRIYGAALKGAGAAIGGIGKGVGKALSKGIPALTDFAGKALPYVGKGLKNIGKGYLSVWNTALKGTFDVAKTAATAIFGKKADQYVDIYRKDEIGGNYKPILTKVRQERGVYFKDRKKVEKSSDIHEPVYDAEGKEIISQEDIDHGIVGPDNKPISSVGSEGLLSKTLGILKGLAPGVGGALKKGMGLYADIYSKLFGLFTGGIKGAGKMVGGFINRLFGFDVGKTSKELIDLVRNIRDDVDLLARGEKKGGKAGDADGDGDVDGSYQDQMQNKKTKEYKKLDAKAEHKDKNWLQEKKDKEKEAADDKKSDSWIGKFWKKFTDSKWFKNNKWLRHGGRRFKALGKVLGKKSWGVIKTVGSKALPFLKTAGGKALTLGAKAMPWVAKAGGAAMHGLGALGSAAGGLLGSAGSAISGGLASMGGLAGIGSTLAAVAGPAALAALAGYGIYRGIKGFSKKNTLENLGESNGVSNENQLTGEDRMYSALGMNSKIGAKTAKFLSQGLGIHGLIKGIRGNDNPLTDKEIEQGKAKLTRKMEKGLPGYDRILQEYEKAVSAGNWRRARELSGQEADGLIKSMWKNSWVGMATSKIGSWIFGDKDKEMSKEEIDKTRERFAKLIEKGGSSGKKAEKLLNKFEDYVAEGDWKRAREIAGMEKRGLFGKLFQDSKGNIQWGKLAGAALGGVLGYGIASLFTKADVNKPMTEEEVAKARERLQKLADSGNKAASKLLDQFDDAVTEQNWKKARKLCGEEVQSNLKKFGGALKSTAKWSLRIATLGLSTLFESDQDKPMTEAEISKFMDKMNYLADKGDKLARKKLDKFEDAVAKQKWSVAREIAKMPHKSLMTRAVKASVAFMFGDDEKEMTEQEMTKFRESMNRKINLGGSTGRAAQKKLDAFEDAVNAQRWKRARTIADMKDDGVVQKIGKGIGKAAANSWRFLFGGDGMAMDEGELEKARKKLNNDIEDGKKGAQRRLDAFEDYVADEKWEKARKIAKLPYENIAKRMTKSVGNWLFGNDENAMSPEEIDKFQKEQEQKIEDGDPKAEEILEKFNKYVESERWEKAREISKIKDTGVVGATKKVFKGAWDWLVGNSDYEDAMKLKEEVEEKILDEEDPSGLKSAALEQMEKLIRRQKYNEAVELGEDIKDMKITELKDKYKLNSDQFEELKKDAETLSKDITSRAEQQTGWINLTRFRLNRLNNELTSNPEKWSDEFFEDVRDRMRGLTGEDQFDDVDRPDEDTVKEGEHLIKDIEATQDNFSWLGSPIIKTRLANLKSEVKSDMSTWCEDTFNDWRKRVKEIAGDDTVDTREAEKPEQVTAPEETGLDEDAVVKDEDLETADTNLYNDFVQGDDTVARSEMKTESYVKIAGDKVGDKLTRKQVAAIDIAKSMGNNVDEMYGPEIMKKYSAAKKGDFEARFTGGKNEAIAEDSEVETPAEGSPYESFIQGDKSLAKSNMPAEPQAAEAKTETKPMTDAEKKAAGIPVRTYEDEDFGTVSDYAPTNVPESVIQTGKAISEGLSSAAGAVGKSMAAGIMPATSGAFIVPAVAATAATEALAGTGKDVTKVTKGFKIAGDEVGEQLTKKQFATMRAALLMGKSLDKYPADVVEKYQAIKDGKAKPLDTLAPAEGKTEEGQKKPGFFGRMLNAFGRSLTGGYGAPSITGATMPAVRNADVPASAAPKEAPVPGKDLKIKSHDEREAMVEAAVKFLEEQCNHHDREFSKNAYEFACVNEKQLAKMAYVAMHDEKFMSWLEDQFNTGPLIGLEDDPSVQLICAYYYAKYAKDEKGFKVEGYSSELDIGTEGKVDTWRGLSGGDRMAAMGGARTIFEYRKDINPYTQKDFDERPWLDFTGISLGRTKDKKHLAEREEIAKKRWLKASFNPSEQDKNLKLAEIIKNKEGTGYTAKFNGKEEQYEFSKEYMEAMKQPWAKYVKYDDPEMIASAKAAWEFEDAMKDKFQVGHLDFMNPMLRSYIEEQSKPVEKAAEPAKGEAPGIVSKLKSFGKQFLFNFGKNPLGVLPTVPNAPAPAKDETPAATPTDDGHGVIGKSQSMLWKMLHPEALPKPEFAPGTGLSSPVNTVSNVSGLLSRPESKEADMSWSNPVMQARILNKEPDMGPTMDAAAKMDEQTKRYDTLVEQNQKLLDLFSQFISKDGLKIAGMDTLTEATIKNAEKPSAPTVIDNTNTSVDGHNGTNVDDPMRSISLRKQQA